MAADGNLYPPERHPDYQGAHPHAQPGEIGSACRSCGGALDNRFCGSCGTDSKASPASPSSPSGSIGVSASSRPRAFDLGHLASSRALLILTAVALVVVIALGGLWFATRLPSVEDDGAAITRALPSDSDIPAGYTSSRGTIFESPLPCKVSNTIPKMRNGRAAGFSGPDGDFDIQIGSYDAKDQATTITSFLGQYPTCTVKSGDAKVAQATGSIPGSDTDQVYVVKGVATNAYIVVASTDRFVVCTTSTNLDLATKFAELAIKRLND